MELRRCDRMTGRKNATISLRTPKFRADIPVVFAAMSKHSFCYRMFITRYILEKGRIPLTIFTLYDYFLLDTVDRKFMIEANNVLVARSDELWIFGPVSEGVAKEIRVAESLGKPVSYFAIQKPHRIVKIPKSQVEYEEGIECFL